MIVAIEASDITASIVYFRKWYQIPSVMSPNTKKQLSCV